MVRPLAFAVSILTLASSSAFAQPSLVQPLAAPAAPVDDIEVVTTSYRDQILITSGLGIGMLLGGAAAESDGGRDTDASDSLFALGGLTTLLAPPIVHFAHGEIARGFGSFGMRYGLAAIGALVAVKLDNCDASEDWFCGLDAIGPGALVGVTVASLIDAFAMSDQRHYRPRTERVFVPVVSATSSGGQVGLAGTF